MASTIFLNRNFDPVDIVAIPSPGGSSYAILAESSIAGTSHKIEIRNGDGTLARNYWMSPENVPIEIELVDGPSGPALSVLRNNIAAPRPNVRMIDLQGNYDVVRRFVEQFETVAMATLPDANNNAYPQAIAFGEKADGRAKAETRDGSSGVFDYRIALNPQFDPLDVAYIGAVPGYGEDLVGLLVKQYPDDFGFATELRVVVLDAETGSKQFQLQFMGLQ